MHNLAKLIREKNDLKSSEQTGRLSRVIICSTSKFTDQVQLYFDPTERHSDDLMFSLEKWLDLSQCNDDLSLQGVLGAVWRHMTGVDLITKVASSGYYLDDTKITIVFIVDLTDSTSVELMKRAKSVIDSFSNEITNLFIASLVVMRRFDSENGELLKAEHSEIVIFFEWLKNNSNLLLLSDAYNSRGHTITNNNDLFSMVAQMTKHLLLILRDSKFESIKNRLNAISPLDGFSCSFSNITFFVPEATIIEQYLVRAGAMWIDESVNKINDNSDEIAGKYLSYLNGRTALVSVDSLRNVAKGLLKNHQQGDPMSFINKMTRDNYTKSINEESDLRLSAYSLANQNISKWVHYNSRNFDKVIKNRILDYYYEVNEVSNQILLTESGSASKLERFFSKSEAQLREIREQIKIDYPKIDLENELVNLKKEKDNLPTIGSVSSRLILIVILAITVLKHFSILDTYFAGSIIVALITIGVYQAYIWLLYTDSIKKKFGLIEKRIQDIWSEHETQSINSHLTKYIDGCIEQLSNCRLQYNKILNRLNSVINYGKNEYTPKEPLQSSFRVNVLSQRDEINALLDTEDRRVDLKNVSLNKFNSYSDNELWARLSDSDDYNLNDYELSLLENAAIGVADNYSALDKVNICNVIASYPDKTRNIIKLAQFNSDPYILVNNSINIGLLITPSSCKNDEIEKILKEAYRIYSDLYHIESSNSGEIHLISITEGVKLNNIIESLE
jgi:hypothetical protein